MTFEWIEKDLPLLDYQPIAMSQIRPHSNDPMPGLLTLVGVGMIPMQCAEHGIYPFKDVECVLIRNTSL